MDKTTPVPGTGFLCHHKAAATTEKQLSSEVCISVRVRPAREQFVVWTECVNCPLFQALLNKADRVGVRGLRALQLGPARAPVQCRVLP
ncbi:auxin-responsive protein SAUR71-like [Canna indica]|uniref:Auxin-responsive protein SAUR71-like n=1 Tax=Canna indica TaxID=4628 RepID=A0AAQ3JV01_9LILI|nr:auxin-responsive protein SAUR71-like [Canna indica]